MNLGVTRLVIAGLQTNVCLEATARSALAHNYQVAIAEDAVSTDGPDLHVGALNSMRVLYAEVAPWRDLLADGVPWDRAFTTPNYGRNPGYWDETTASPGCGRCPTETQPPVLLGRLEVDGLQRGSPRNEGSDMKVSVTAISALVATLATTALTGGLLGATPAQADDASGGVVVAKGGVNVRSLPTTVGYPLGVIKNGTHIALGCKVHGTSIDGNDRWYSVLGHEGPDEWVSARYVRNLGVPDWCGDGHKYVGQTTALVNLRVGPTRAEAISGAVGTDTRVSLVCKLRGEAVNGNSWWYETKSGHWISARYVKNVGTSPAYCS